MYWILQTNMYSEAGWHGLVDALERLGVKHTVHRVVPFDHVLDPEPVVAPEERVLVMGTLTLARIARARGWRPGSFYDRVTFDVAYQRDRWGSETMFNGAGAAYRIRDIPFSSIPVFVRPTNDTKAFVGQVMDAEQITVWRDQLARLLPEDHATCDLDTWAWVAPLRQIDVETRLFIVDQEIVTGSVYRNGALKRYSSVIDPKVLEFGKEMARRWSPARAYALDVFMTNGVPYVGEVNNINSAGFYAADMNLLVGALEAMDAPIDQPKGGET